MNPTKLPLHRLGLAVCLAGALLIGIFAAAVVSLRSGLRAEIRETIIGRTASVLRPVALRQLAQREPAGAATDLLGAVLESAQQEDMLAVSVFDEQGRLLQYAPDALLFPELRLADYLELLQGRPISRFHPAFPLNRYFAGIGSAPHETPVLEVWLPLHGPDADRTLGFAQYLIDGRALAGELAAIDRRVQRQTAATLAIGAALITAVLALSYAGLRRARRIIAERNERLIRSNFELTLAAKASALGQITSHLIHGLRGPVAGLRAVVSSRGSDAVTTEDWQTAVGYTERMQTMIEEAVGLLQDETARNQYELTGYELAEIIRRRSAPLAAAKGVTFAVSGGFDHPLDNHRGGLLCLIVSNLAENAVRATPAGGTVAVMLRNGGASATVLVSDEGGGISPDVLPHLFEPGRSGNGGGSGLGLAISQLLARQIGATLALESTGSEGTTFRLTVPLDSK